MKICSILFKERHYRLVVAGGGTGGLAVTSHFSRLLPKGNVAVIEPNKKHYYQPGLTLVGGGIWTVEKITKNESDFIPKNSTWINEKILKFEPKNNCILLRDGDKIFYDFLVIATGLELRYDLISGLGENFKSVILDPLNRLCSIYSPKFAPRTFDEIQRFESGNAIFTFPNTPIKCPGAPQKICYLAEQYFQKTGKRSSARVIFNSSIGKIFGVEKYANELWKIVKERGIEVNFRHSLSKVDVKNHLATFDLLDENSKPCGKTADFQYSLLHISPPCSGIEPLRDHELKDGLTDSNGWLRVDPKTLQSTAFDNIYAIGDCTTCPGTKTSAAISSQFRVLKENLTATMNGKNANEKYDGYTSCPLIVDYGHVILAEFDYSGKPLETFPMDQSKPTKWAYLMKRYGMPFLYWKFLLGGYWTGPAPIRKMLNWLKKD